MSIHIHIHTSDKKSKDQRFQNGQKVAFGSHIVTYMGYMGDGKAKIKIPGVGVRIVLERELEWTFTRQPKGIDPNSGAR